jgi:hypothetical protein
MSFGVQEASSDFSNIVILEGPPRRGGGILWEHQNRIWETGAGFEKVSKVGKSFL